MLSNLVWSECSDVILFGLMQQGEEPHSNHSNLWLGPFSWGILTKYENLIPVLFFSSWKLVAYLEMQDR